MIELRILDKYIPGSPVIPIAGLLSSAKTSNMVQVSSQIHQLFDYTVFKILNWDESDTAVTPFWLPENVSITDLQSLKNSIIVSTLRDYNIYYDLPIHTTAIPDIKLYNAETNRAILRFKVLFNNSGQWLETPAAGDDQEIRILLYDEDVASNPIIVKFSSISSGVLKNNVSHLLNTANVAAYESSANWSLGRTGNYLTVIWPGISVPLYVKQNAFNRIRMVMPYREWYNEWFMLISRGYIAGTKSFYTTTLNGTNYPASIIKDDPARPVTGNIFKVSYPDINTAAAITIYFDGEEQTDLDVEISSRFGLIQLPKAVSASVKVTVDYRINHTNWIESNMVDFNPHANHSTGTIYNATAISVKYLLQPIELGGLLMFSISSNPGIAMPDGFGYSSGAVISSNWAIAAEVRTIEQDAIKYFDIRHSGGQLKESFRSKVGWTGFTDLGFFDGQPVENIAIIIRLPDAVYTDLYRRFYDQGLSAYEAKTATEKYITEAVSRFAPAGVNIILQNKSGQPYFQGQ